MNKLLLPILCLFLLSLGACKPKMEPDAPGAGGLDFSRYVAVGNSLTAGYADGTLYRSGQLNSYPNILANQFRLLGGGDFKIPLLPGEYGYPGAKRVLGYSRSMCSADSSLGPVIYKGLADTAGSATNISAQGPFNNVGVPGIRAIDFLFAGYGLFNPYAQRFYAPPFTQRPLDEATRINATFFTLWIGNNDVLAYATSGGEGNLNGTGLGQNDISSPALFKICFDSVVNAMTRRGAKGAVLNIPDVTAIPFFNTIPANALVLTAGQADTLNLAYAGTGIHFVAGANNFVIEDPAVPVIGRRMIKNGELLLLTLPQDSLKCARWGSVVPIPKRYVLDATEIGNVRTATTNFNQIMAQGAAAHKLAYVDMNSYLKTINSGILFNGVSFNTVFVQGGTFSLDGVHLTPRGYAVVANEVIRRINLYYDASIPAADVNSYPGIRFP